MKQNRELQYRGICQIVVVTMFLFLGMFYFHNLSVQAAETDAPQIELADVWENGKEGLEQRVTAVLSILNYDNTQNYPYEYRVVGTDKWEELTLYFDADDDQDGTSWNLDWAEAEGLRYGDRVEVRAKIGGTYTKSGYFKVLTDEVLNGNFEITKSGTFLKEREDIYGWRTTNPEGTIDVSSDGAAYNLEGARRGKNFAVLDSSKDEVLYQEIKVTPGQELRWTLSHAAYKGNGSFLVIVGPALSASESYNDKNTDGLTLFQQIGKETPRGGRWSTIKLENGKAYVAARLNGDTESWKDRSYQYTVPEGENELVFALLPLEDKSGTEVSKSVIDDIEFGKGAVPHIWYYSHTISIGVDNISEDKDSTVYALLDKDGKIVCGWTGKEEEWKAWEKLPLDRAPYTMLKSSNKMTTPNKDRDKQFAVINTTEYKGNHLQWSVYRNFAYIEHDYDAKDLTSCQYANTFRYFKPADGYSWNGNVPQVTDENGNIQEIKLVDKEKEIYSMLYRVPDTPGSVRIVEEPTLNMKVKGIKENDSFKGKASFSIEGVENPDKVTVKADGDELERQEDGTYVLLPRTNPYTVTATDEYGNTLEIKNVKVDWLGEVDVPEIASKTYNGFYQTADIEDGQIDGIEYTVLGNMARENAGTYTILLELNNPEYRWKDRDNVEIEDNGSVAKVPFIIKKAIPEVTPPKGKHLIEDGWKQELVEPGRTEDGELMYRLSYKDSDGEWKWAEEEWSRDIPTAKELPGDPVCRIYYKVIGDENHEDTEEAFVEASLRCFTVELRGSCFGSAKLWVKASEISKVKVFADGEEVSGQDGEDYREKYYVLAPREKAYNIYVTDGYGNEKKFDNVKVDWCYVTPPVSESKVYTGSNLISDLADGVVDRNIEGHAANGEYEVIKNDGGTDVGTYDVVLRLKDTVNYKWYVEAGSDIQLNEDGTEATVPFTITKAVPEITEIPAAKKLTCTGEPQELVTKGMTTGGTLEYSLDGESWSADIPKAVEAGEYTVYYRVNGGVNYEDIEAESVTVIIEKKKEQSKPQSKPQNKPQPNTTKKNTAQGDIYLNAGLKVKPSGNKLSIVWGRVPKATGYDVYVQYCGKKYNANSLYQVKSGKTTKLIVKKINKKKINLKKEYRIYVVAYRKNKGKKVVLAKTITAHVVGRLHKKATNVKEIRVAKTSYTLKKGAKQKIKAKSVLMNKKKQQLSNKHAREFRFASGNPKVASVSSSGIIKAVGKGSCTVYVYARNGYTKAIKVTVK